MTGSSADRRRKASGFTLLEVLVAVVILSVSLVAVLKATYQMQRAVFRSQQQTTAVQLASQRLQRVLHDPFASRTEDSGTFDDERYEEFVWTQSHTPIEVGEVGNLSLLAVTVSWTENADDSVTFCAVVTE